MKCFANIWHQLNTFPGISIPRFVGNRFDKYELIVYVDASKIFHGATLYIKEVTCSKLTFCAQKNRLITSILKAKFIASLELLAVEFGTQLMHDIGLNYRGLKHAIPSTLQK